MRTCWVLDHPAHVRLLAEFLRNGTTADLIVACERAEVQAMLEQGMGACPDAKRSGCLVPWAKGGSERRFTGFEASSVFSRPPVRTGRVLWSASLAWERPWR